MVGVAQDLDVSAGKTTPFDRPQLGKWLKRPQDYDVIVFFRVDRIVRRLFDLADLIRWSREHGVTLVSATEAHFDLSTEFGDIIALLVAKVAELELQAISERNASAFKHNYSLGKWRGGMAPWGYVPAQIDGEWRLTQDPEQVTAILEVVERVLKGEPLRSIAHDLTRRGVATPRDMFARYQGREEKGYEWHSGPLKRALTSPTLLGRVVTREVVKDAQGRPQRDTKGRKVFGREALVVTDDGTPVVRAEPILTREVFDRVGVELSGRENRKEPTKRSSGLLLRILYCGVCDQPAYRLKGGPGRKPRYRCSSEQKLNACGNKTIPLDYAEEEVEKAILANLGPFERKTRVWFSGEDHTDELREVNDAILDITDLLGTPAFRRGTKQRARLDKRLEALSARQQELEQSPRTAPGWRYESTGELFSDWWKAQDVEAKNVYLRTMGFRWVWESHSGPNGRIVVDEFKQVGQLVMDLDADQLFGPIADIMAALSEDVPPE